MQSIHFGYAGRWSQSFPAVQQAAQLVKSSPTPVGVEILSQPYGQQPWYRVATNLEYQQAALSNRIAYTA